MRCLHVTNKPTCAMTQKRPQSPLGDSTQRKKDTRLSSELFRRLNCNLIVISLVILNGIVQSECAKDDEKDSVNEDKFNKISFMNYVQDDLDDALNLVVPELMNKTEDVKYKSDGRVYNNGTFRTGNSLWDGILNQCTVNPSLNCLQKNVYTYLEKSVGFDGDVNVTSGVCFKKNGVDYNKYSKEANIIYMKGSSKADVQEEEESRAKEEENEIKDDEESESPFEEVTDSLYDRSLQFLMTHDLRLNLPETFFHGATLKLSPRALTRTGALVHVDIEPSGTDVGDGRIFFKKIKKYFQKKLLMAGLAILLVVKLIKLKLFFVLPLIIGVGAAKKIVLKFVLFIFPALSHIFKLCSWYHQNYHTTKFHHHHHLISHHHHKAPPAYHVPTGHVSYSSPHSAHSGHGGHVVVQNEPSSGHEHYPQDWELSGPGLGSEYIAAGVHRNAIANFKPHMDDVNDINSWGLGLPPGQASMGPSAGYIPTSVMPNSIPTMATSPTGHHASRPVFINSGRPIGPPGGGQVTRLRRPTSKDLSLQAEKDALLRAAALAARAPPSPVRDEVLRVSAAQLAEATRAQAEKKLVQQQQQILAATDPDTVSADRFYGALVEKVDKVLMPLGAREQGCRERAICSLYRDPIQHTPYSNLVSNELSKDSSELQPPGGSQLALRYYRYVQAARDGQEQKDCLGLYPHCDAHFHK